MTPAGLLECPRLFGRGRTGGRRQRRVGRRPRERPDEALEVPPGRDREEARLSGLDPIGVRNVAGGEQNLPRPRAKLPLLDSEPYLAREHVEDLVLGPVEMQRRRVALSRTVLEHRDAVRPVEMADADQHQRVDAGMVAPGPEVGAELGAAEVPTLTDRQRNG